MSVSLKYLYHEVMEYGVNLIAGEKGLKNQVKWTHIAENEEIVDFIQGKELVFTTGLAMKNDEDLLKLVKKANERDASGLIVFIGKYIENISDKVIDYCDNSNFPLFTVPWGMEMSDTMRSLTINIIESEKTYIEISNALKDAIFLHEHSELYMPRLNKVGFKNEWRYIVTLMELESKDINVYRVEEHTSQMINFIEEELAYIRNNFFCLSAGQSIIIIFYNKNEQEIESILKNIYKKMVKEFNNANFYIAMENQSNNLQNLHQGYKEAKKISKINRLLRNNNAHLKYNEVGLYKLLLDLYDKDKMKSFYDKTLGDLAFYDKVNNTDYVEILINYFENNCSIIETANTLYIHRNTMNYKINKIEQILDINLSDIGDRSKIYIALMIKYLL
ncbi:PucR family transcriptional regulator [Terrisporobacter sp.]|uniref:PucR family transcriptional regulator n=1 Tax=Terrisporobacter sp. TaxID=1965305 RepID=UPI0026372358|nr:PucR family transcriptional regulator [Terrisporobacter sp.]